MAADDPYQSLARIRARVDHEPNDFFEDNAEKRFDRLLMGTTAVGDTADGDPDEWDGLEAEARGWIETMLGDETLNEETGRVDEIRPGYDSALTLVFPITDVTKVEYKTTLSADWQTLDADRYTHTEHNLILETCRRGRTALIDTRRNTLADAATRGTWADLAARLRVTYDRGFAEIPLDIKSVQIQIINRMLRLLRAEQTFAAASPEEWQGVSPEFDRVITEDIRDRVADVTTLGGATSSV